MITSSVVCSEVLSIRTLPCNVCSVNLGTNGQLRVKVKGSNIFATGPFLSDSNAKAG